MTSQYRRFLSTCLTGLLTVFSSAAFVLPNPTTGRSDDVAPTASADRPEVDLSAVTDNDYLTYEENEAYYGLLHRATITPLNEMRREANDLLQQRRQATPFPIFKDMLDHPELYRGQPVTLRGHVLNVVSYDAAENPWGIRQVYEAALFTDDSQGHPATIVFTERPEGLPLGDKLVDGVEVTGYFFKIYYYPSADKVTRRAPLILASTLQIRPVVPHAPLVPGWVANGGIALVVIVLVAVVWWVQSRDQRLSRQRQRHDIQVQIPEWNDQASPSLPRIDDSPSDN